MRYKEHGKVNIPMRIIIAHFSRDEHWWEITHLLKIIRGELEHVSPNEPW